MAFDTSGWKERATFVNTGSSFRHVVVSPNGMDLYVSDMGTNRIFRLNAADLSQRTVYSVGHNPNTIDLSPDGKRLFVSCRGPNNPKSYYLRSLVDGEIYIIDTVSNQVEEILSGGNQPTGLDVSTDGRFLAFTNFLDNEVEVYEAR
jgi:DNA-binding beta-propeller fold protein YncE